MRPSDFGVWNFYNPQQSLTKIKIWILVWKLINLWKMTGFSMEWESNFPQINFSFLYLKKNLIKNRILTLPFLGWFVSLCCTDCGRIWSLVEGRSEKNSICRRVAINLPLWLASCVIFDTKKIVLASDINFARLKHPTHNYYIYTTDTSFREDLLSTTSFPSATQG